MVDVDGREVMLGRIPNPPDVRDANYPMSAILPATPPPALTSVRRWARGPVRLNQGTLGACVSFAGSNWDQSQPIMGAVTNAEAVANYWACKQIDGIPDTEGTYDRALMKVYAAQGKIESYHWADDIEAFWQWLMTMGPILIGVNWYRAMFTPDAAHIIRPGGPIDGGHEVEVFEGEQHLDGSRWCRIENSWGDWWGDDGTAWIALADLQRLIFNEGGDACAALQAGGPMSELHFDRMPAEGPITGRFGEWYAGPPPYQHRGVDIGCPMGTPVYAPAGGLVVPFTNDGTFGLGVCLDHETAPYRYSLYAHNSALLVELGDSVKTGQQIALSGGTGKVSGPHCHWQVCKLATFPVDIGYSADPLQYLGEDEDMTAIEELLVATFGAMGEQSLPWPERVRNAEYRKQLALRGTTDEGAAFPPLAGQIAEHAAMAVPPAHQ